mgnify:CR=1 FL=1
MKLNLFFRTFLMVFATLWLGACASLQEHHLYDGEERSQDELLTVEVPHLLEIMTVNGKALANDFGKLLGNNDRVLYLLPGRYEIDAYYKQFWDNNIESHTVVRSQPVTFVVEGKAGETVSMDFERPKRLNEAETFAKNFEGWTLNTTTGEKKPTRATTTRRPSLLASLQDDQPKAENTETVKPLKEEDVLLRLKSLWRVASEKEQREFLLWVSE